MNAQVDLEEARRNLAQAEAEAQKAWRAKHDAELEKLCLLGRELTKKEAQLVAEFAEAEAKCVAWGEKMTRANAAINNPPPLPEFPLRADIAKQDALLRQRIAERDALIADEQRNLDVAVRDRLQRELDEAQVQLASVRAKEASQRAFIANNYRIGDGSGVFRVSL